MKVSVITKPLDQVKADALIVLIDGKQPFAQTANAHLGKHLETFITEVAAGRTKREWFCTLEKEGGCKTHHLLLDAVQFGPDVAPSEKLKIAAARAIGLCREYSLKHLAVAVHTDNAATHADAILEGMLLGDFLDDRFKSGAEKRPDLKLDFMVHPGDDDAVSKVLKRREQVCAGQNNARLLVNAPHHVLTPEEMASHAAKLAKKYGMECTILKEKELRKEGYIPTWEVGRGSEYPPRMIVLRYKPKKKASKTHVGLVGKGMTYDTGGLCIKTRQSMYKMNYDMGGAGAVLGAMEAIARLKLPIRVTAVICSAHNAVDGAAYHPGCIIKAKNGKTIHVENTDAEGRLILTDALHRAGEEGAEVLIDFATLTGSVANALGPACAGLFTEDDGLRDLLMGAGFASGDELWHLPLIREYQSLLNHHLADLNNMGSDPAGSGIHAANFLKQFVPENVRWAHIDIAGTANADKPRKYFGKGATGYGVRLAVEALERMIEADSKSS